jgi:hypothetical protein
MKKRIERQAGYLQELKRDARSTEHKIHVIFSAQYSPLLRLLTKNISLPVNSDSRCNELLARTGK